MIRLRQSERRRKMRAALWGLALCFRQLGLQLLADLVLRVAYRRPAPAQFTNPRSRT